MLVYHTMGIPEEMKLLPMLDIKTTTFVDNSADARDLLDVRLLVEVDDSPCLRVPDVLVPRFIRRTCRSLLMTIGPDRAPSLIRAGGFDGDAVKAICLLRECAGQGVGVRSGDLCRAYYCGCTQA